MQDVHNYDEVTSVLVTLTFRFGVSSRLFLLGKFNSK